MSGLKNNISDRVWIDQYPDGSLYIVDDGENWETDRVRVGLSHDEMMKLIGTYIKEHSEWKESAEKEERAIVLEEAE